MRHRFALAIAGLLGPTLPAIPCAAQTREEPLEQTYCRLIEAAASSRALPVTFFTRLIWRESSFHPNVTSPAGAQGIAQFMPGTANERGLANPFDPEEALPKAAGLLADLRRRFGNLGLAAAAYNAGPARVSAWLAGGYLPEETRNYVMFITGRAVEDWKSDASEEPVDAAPPTSPRCDQILAKIRLEAPSRLAESTIFAPWGVQLAGGFSKAKALAQYERARKAYAAELGGLDPMVIGGRLRSRGSSAFYRVRAPAQTRAAANAICAKIVAAGGACFVLRS